MLSIYDIIENMQRLLEFLTGFIPWLILLFPLWGSFFIPVVVAYFVLGFDIYWLYRSIHLAVNTFLGFRQIKKTTSFHWLQQLKKQKFPWQKIHHLVIIPNYKESVHKMEKTITSLANQTFPAKKITLILAMEKKEKDACEKATFLQKKFIKNFAHFWTTYHPSDIPGETPGKSSNEAWAGKYAQKKLSEETKIPLKNITITTCDADSIFPKDYFSLLTYKFLKAKNPYLLFWQAPIFQYNNINKLPVIIRILSITSGIIFLSNLVKISKRFFNYSTYSASLKLMSEIGFWDVDVIPEDWHVFLKAFYQTAGKVEIQPLFLPVYTDAPYAKTLRKTFLNRYHQCKREAWGATDIPYAVRLFFQHAEIPLGKRLLRLSVLLESHFTWTTHWFILTLGATIPSILNPKFNRTIIGYNLSKLSGFVLTLCLFGLLAIIVFDYLLRPKTQKEKTGLFHPLTYLRWLLLPLSGLLFATLPGLEAQTRIMLGKKLKYRVTEKY